MNDRIEHENTDQSENVKEQSYRRIGSFIVKLMNDTSSLIYTS